MTPTIREATVNDKNTDSFARLRRRIYVKESEPLTRSKQVSPLLEIGTMGLKRRGLETGSTEHGASPRPNQPVTLGVIVTECDDVGHRSIGFHSVSFPQRLEQLSN